MQPRRLSRLFHRAVAQSGAHETLLSQPHFRAALRRERLRADRCLIGFSMLTLAVDKRAAKDESVADIVQVLKCRVRESDIAGWFADGVIGIILPDTATAGAWKLAEHLQAVFDRRQISAEFQVYVYPWTDTDEGNPPADAVCPDIQTPLAEKPVQPMTMLFVRKLPVWKRTIDVLGATAGLALVSPGLLLVAVAIKLTSPGPIFYAQQRDGLGGRRFWIYKFRTMVVNADALQASLRQVSEQDGPAFKLKRDPRVTRIGRLLRRTCVDELPQLWNVLRGDMSIVGPRPLPVMEARQCAPWERRRLDVTPGLTCTWQVYGGTKVTFTEWMRMDLRYIGSHSLLNDLRLMILTVPSVIRRDGVY